MNENQIAFLADFYELLKRYSIDYVWVDDNDQIVFSSNDEDLSIEAFEEGRFEDVRTGESRTLGIEFPGNEEA